MNQEINTQCIEMFTLVVDASTNGTAKRSRSELTEGMKFLNAAILILQIVDSILKSFLLLIFFDYVLSFFYKFH